MALTSIFGTPTQQPGTQPTLAQQNPQLYTQQTQKPATQASTTPTQSPTNLGTTYQSSNGPSTFDPSAGVDYTSGSSANLNFMPLPSAGDFSKLMAGTSAGAAPQYQTYQFSPIQVSAYSAPEMISPQTVQQYQAPGSLPAQQAPRYTAGQVSQYGGSNVSPLTSLAGSLAQGLPQFATVNQQALDEQQKETLLAAKQAQEQALQTQFARQGTGDSGALAAALANAESNFGGQLTGAYRDVALQSQQQDFNNQLAAIQGIGNQAAQQAQIGQSEYGTGLQGQLAQQQLLQQQTALGQSSDQQALNQALALEGLRQAQAQSSLQAGQYGLSKDQLDAQLANQAFQNSLSGGQFNLQQQQAQANQDVATNQLNLQGLLGMTQNNLSAQKLMEDYLLGLGGLNVSQQGLQLQGANDAANQNLSFLQMVYGAMGGA